MNEKLSKKTDEIEDSKAPLISHLIELRDRLKWAVLFFFLTFCLCYYFANTIYNFLVEPLYQIYIDKRFTFSNFSTSLATFPKNSL